MRHTFLGADPEYGHYGIARYEPTLVGRSAECVEGDICRHCAATIADPETLRTLAEWFDNPSQTKAVVCQLGGQRYTLGMIFREVADAIDSQAGTMIAEPVETSTANRSTVTDSTTTDDTYRKGAVDDRH